MEKQIDSLAGLAEEAGALLSRLRTRDGTATLVTLSGELGAGKTAFIQAVAKALGVEGVVISPTFVLLKIYALPPGNAWKRLAHIDAYRLANGAELLPLGFDELMRDPGTLLLLEWPERVLDALPLPAVAMTLTALPDGTRRIRYD